MKLLNTIIGTLIFSTIMAALMAVWLFTGFIQDAKGQSIWHPDSGVVLNPNTGDVNSVDDNGDGSYTVWDEPDYKPSYDNNYDSNGVMINDDD